MPENVPRSLNSSTETLQLQMERSIDQLGNLARSGIEPEIFLRDVLKNALQPGGATRAILWRQSEKGDWKPVGEVPGPESLGPGEIELRQEFLVEVSQSEQPRLLEEVAGISSFLSPIRASGQTVAVLETSHSLEKSGRLPSTAVQFFAALSEITADFLSHYELQQLRLARATWIQWDHYSQRLWQSLDLTSVCAVIANDGRLLVDCDRVSVLVRRGRSYLLKSVSGVDRIEPRSTATRSIESLARLVVRQGGPLWSNSNTPSNGTEFDPRLTENLQLHIRDSGATAVGIVPVIDRPNATERTAPPAVIVFEQFRPLMDPERWQIRGDTLVNRSGPALRSALEQSEIPWLGLWQRVQRWPSLIVRPATLCVLALLMGLVAALVLIPAEFTVSGPAELWPEQRREVFASTSGIIDQILVSHGDDVALNQPLIVLRDPELEADTPRILGEIATVNERLKGVQSARLTGGNTPDSASRSRQLAVDEQELKERLRTLEQQRLALDERQQGLTLRSPIAGKILTWDVAQQLSSRPVERGQSLLTIGETSGPWIVEVHVADKDIGHMLRAQQSLKPDLDVEFLLATEPGQTYRGRVQETSLSVEADDDARSRVRVVVGFDRTQIEKPRPGATALPRIHCGPRSLGYVWLHDLIDAIRTRLLF